MVLLQYLVPTLATLLIGILGTISPTGHSSQMHYAWLTLFGIFALMLSFDRSRGRWISYIVVLMLTTFTIGLYIDEPQSFMSWACCIFLSVSTIFVVSQLVLHAAVRFLIVGVATVIAILPAVLSRPVFSYDEMAYVVPTAAVIFSLFPFFLQYVKTFRPEIVWTLISLQQLVLRLGFVVWAFQWKPVLINVNIANLFREPMVGVLLGLFLVSNIKPNRLSWAHVSMTAYSLIIIFASLFRAHEIIMLIYMLIGIMAFGSIFPIKNYVAQKRNSDLSALELGAFGSAGFFISLWMLYKMQSKLEMYEFVLWSAFTILVSSKIWSQADREQVFGKTLKENSKLYFYGRVAVHGAVFLYFISLLLNQRFNFIT